MTGIHNAGHYSVCYVEAGAYQSGFPDDSNIAAADYGSAAKKYQMQGYSDEWWFDLNGFAGWTASNPTKFPGGTAADQANAANIAAGLDKRFGYCKTEGHDAAEADDLDGYTNKSASGASGGGWGLTQGDSQGFEAWLAYDTHNRGLAWFMKNDTDNAQSAVKAGADAYIIEECNYYKDPCGTKTVSGDVTPFLEAGLPVLNAEYTQDGESTLKFCSADNSAGIYGALFNVDLAGGTYSPCWTSNGSL